MECGHWAGAVMQKIAHADPSPKKKFYRRADRRRALEGYRSRDGRDFKAGGNLIDDAIYVTMMALFVT